MSRKIEKAAIALSASSISEWSNTLLSSANSLAGDGGRDVASVAELVWLGRCVMSNEQGTVRLGGGVCRFISLGRRFRHQDGSLR